MSLTPEQLLEHERSDKINGCPVCGSHQVDGASHDSDTDKEVTLNWWCCDCGTEFKSTFEITAVEITKPCEPYTTLEHMVTVFGSHTLSELKVLCIDNGIELINGRLFKTEDVYKIRDLMDQN